jgi:hypothetical protein
MKNYNRIHQKNYRPNSFIERCGMHIYQKMLHTHAKDSMLNNPRTITTLPLRIDLKIAPKEELYNTLLYTSV